MEERHLVVTAIKNGTVLDHIPADQIYRVMDLKKVIRMPKEITGIAKCNNPKCITNHEPIRTKFTTVEKNGETFMLCHYCEKMTPVKNIKIISGE